MRKSSGSYSNNICFNYQNHGGCHCGKRCRFLHIENDHFNSKPGHGENRYANFNKQNNFNSQCNFDGVDNTNVQNNFSGRNAGAAEQSENHGGMPKAVKAWHGLSKSATPRSAASTIIFHMQVRNSVLPDSGASVDGKSLKKKQKESEFGGVGRKKLDQTQHLYH